MPWYGWVILALGAFIAITAVCLRILRATSRGRRFLALTSRAKLRFGRLLLADPHTGWPAKFTLVVLVGYLALPFDLIPDFIPVIGQLDDIAVIFIAVAILILAVPRERFEAALTRAEQEAEARKAAAAAGTLSPDRDDD
jgi:uncharacterized membrane protein YkvA (DUF1232 family)